MQVRDEGYCQVQMGSKLSNSQWQGKGGEGRGGEERKEGGVGSRMPYAHVLQQALSMGQA